MRSTKQLKNSMDKNRDEKWRKYPDYDEPPSELIESICIDYGTSDTVCRCGRTHFATENDYWSDTEEAKESLEEFIAEAFKDPEQYQMHDEHSISVTAIGGDEFVVGCPCNGLVRYEQFILANREVILKFLTRKAEKDLEVAARKAEDAWKAQQAEERLERTRHL